MEKSLHLNEEFAQFIKTRDHYFANALETMQKKEFRKASEFLWGSVSQSIKALAYLSGILLRGHNQTKDYVRGLSGQIGDKKLYDLFLSLEDLHRNFYDEQIDERDFPIFFQKTTEFMEKIENLIKKMMT